MMQFLASLEQLRFSVWVRESGSVWAYPLYLFLHTMGMGIVVGLSAMFDLRLLGMSPKTPIKPLERLFPYMWLGFGINAVTGVVLLMVDATTKLANPTFYVKMIFIFVGVWVLKVMRRKVFTDLQLDLGPVPGSVRNLAWASLICWFAAIAAGRLLAYLGPVSGLTEG